MAKAPAFQLYAADLLTDTMDWTDEELGAHMRLMCWSWVNRRGIPRDFPRLSRIAPAAEKCWGVIGPKWKEAADGTLENDRLEKTRGDSDAFRARQKEKSDLAAVARKEKGVKGGRKKKVQTTPVDIPQDVSAGHPAGHPLEGEEEVEGITQEKKEHAHEAEIEPTFDQWFDLYDKRRDKSQCAAKWKTIPRDVRLVIMEHTRAYIASQPDKQFRKDPLRYLTKGAWNDEVITAQTASKNKTDEQYRNEVIEAARQRFGSGISQH